MNRKIVDSLEPVHLIGGGECNLSALNMAIHSGLPIVAADGGALPVLANGAIPDAVIGDMDSVSHEARAQIPAERLHRIEEQDSTDFDKCLRHISAPLVIGHGFLGARLDHQMAALSTLAQQAHRRCVLIGSHDVVCALPPELSLDLPQGTRLSLFPMAQVTGTSQGLVWPIKDLPFAPTGPVGTSNAVCGPVHLTMHAPGMLLMLPVAFSDHLQDAMRSAASEWPAQA